MGRREGGMSGAAMSRLAEFGTFRSQVRNRNVAVSAIRPCSVPGPVRRLTSAPGRPAP
ncbi:MAG: hypothetical protein FD152_1887 [Xanthobacteraceae bacterium]|nr:MAG: hypothetical protein FD152_1887 [Xanthobacteraceae bacterium]